MPKVHAGTYSEAGVWREYLWLALDVPGILVAYIWDVFMNVGCRVALDILCVNFADTPVPPDGLPPTAIQRGTSGIR